jgi:hypothetical protein
MSILNRSVLRMAWAGLACAAQAGHAAPTNLTPWGAETLAASSPRELVQRFVPKEKNLMLAEFTRTAATTAQTADLASCYAMLAYQYGALTPYYFHAIERQNPGRSAANWPAAGAPADLAASDNSALMAGQQSTAGVGVRWDYSKTTVFRIQLDQVRPGDRPLAPVAPASAPRSTSNVFSAGLGFIY